MASHKKSESVESKRPMSPHLQIYKPQITSVMSILHRITGVILSVGLLVFLLNYLTQTDLVLHVRMFALVG